MFFLRYHIVHSCWRSRLFLIKAPLLVLVRSRSCRPTTIRNRQNMHCSNHLTVKGFEVYYKLQDSVGFRQFRVQVYQVFKSSSATQRVQAHDSTVPPEIAIARLVQIPSTSLRRSLHWALMFHGGSTDTIRSFDCTIRCTNRCQNISRQETCKS